METEKTFYFVETKNERGVPSYYGKGMNRLPIGYEDNIAWYIKEYGFDTEQDAKKLMPRIKRTNIRLHCPPIASMGIAKTTLIFQEAAHV